MKKKYLVFHFLYYILTVVIYMAFFSVPSLYMDITGKDYGLGFAMTITYGTLFLMTPVLIAVLMRFSLFKWYVDPIAAAEIPLFLYTVMLINQTNRSGNLQSAFVAVNSKLSNDSGSGWLFLGGMFLFGLVMSFSFARKEEQSISYRLLAKILRKDSVYKPDLSVNADDRRTTDWNFDFARLPHWDIRDTVPFVYDQFYDLPQSDMLCCIYSVAELHMGWNVGCLAVLKNKEDPELILNIAEGIRFLDNFSANKNGDILFLQPTIYKENAPVCPILIIDLTNKRFAYYHTNNNYNPCYKITETDNSVFVIEADEMQKKTDERLNATDKQRIEPDTLEWSALSQLNAVENN